MRLQIDNSLPRWKKNQLNRAIKALRRADIYTTTQLSQCVRTGKEILRKKSRHGPVIIGLGRRGIIVLEEEFDITFSS